MVRKALKDKMKERNVKPQDLAVVIGKTTDFIYKIMAGTRNPTIGQAKAIADFLESSVDYLFFNSNLDDSSNYSTVKEAI